MTRRVSRLTLLIAAGLLIGAGAQQVTARSLTGTSAGDCSPGFPTCWFSPSCDGDDICRGWECFTIVCNDPGAPQEYCYRCERAS